uniref:Myozenin 2a n=1 Tax=Takifugu rubripes TaxID=31033 RepID=A0A674N326_TAKRU
MSQFSTMTTGERKMQAAAICREIHPQEDAEVDLGKKVSVPKDIMLEELSLTSNRGSRLFKMRQKRSEKYTFESVHNENNVQPNVREPQMNLFDSAFGGLIPQSLSLLCSSPERPNVTLSGYGVPLKDVPPEKFNSTAMPKSYQSPWEKAVGVNLALTEAPVPCPPSQPQSDQPVYKSFNRVAIPFGGFSKEPRPDPVRTLKVEPFPDYPELQGHTAPNQPSFNRSALGWVSTCAPFPVPALPLEHVHLPESEDL